jgi:hypothetical protein
VTRRILAGNADVRVSAVNAESVARAFQQKCPLEAVRALLTARAAFRIFAIMRNESAQSMVMCLPTL